MQIFERPRKGERTVLVFVSYPADKHGEALPEFRDLAISAGAQPVALIEAKRRTLDPAFLVGKGKLEEIRATVQAHGAELVIFSHELSPGQERNLEKELSCRVLDRTGLILRSP